MLDPSGDLPSQIGPFEILGPLGEGGMGIVCRARHRDNGNLAALKTVRTPEPTELAGIRREIHALSRVQHPGVVRFLDHGVTDGRPWYAMELLEGRTVRTVIDELHPWRLGNPSKAKASVSAPQPRSNSFDAATATDPGSLAAPQAEETRTIETVDQPVRPHPGIGATGTDTPVTQRPPSEGLADALRLAARICSPLEYLHGEGIVHRDLKPANIFVASDDQPVLMDFGIISRFYGDEGREVMESGGVTSGTPGYMAPEQIHAKRLDARADLYALGVVLYELVTGMPPFARASMGDTLRAQLFEKPAPPSQRVAGLPEGLDELILRLLDREPRRRIGHADDVRRFLSALGVDDSTQGEAPAPRSYLYRPELAGRREILAQLEPQIEEIHAKNGGVILLGGESGVGKTFLASRLADHGVHRGARAIAGECSGAAGQAVGAPLRPLRPCLQAVADLCTQQGADTTERLLGESAHVLSAFEPALAHIPGVDAWPEPAELPPDAARERILSMLESTIVQFSREQPLLLLIDDLQWGDDLTLGFLRRLTRRSLKGVPLVVIGTYRLEETHELLSWLAEQPSVQHHALGKLDHDSIGQMVGDMLALREAPGDLVSFLMQHSEGNPFFVAEYLRATVAEQLLSRQDGRWRVRSVSGASQEAYDSLPLPKSLQSLVGRRLAGLPESASRLAEEAAVLGSEFEADLLMAATGLSEDDTFEALHRLTQRQILEEQSGGRLQFVHHKILEVTYDRIGDERRPDYHRSAAQQIETRYQEAAGFETWFPSLAVHWREARVPDRAVDYFEKAGEHALKISGYADAVRHLTESQALAESSGLTLEALRLARLDRQIGEAHVGLADHPESRARLSRSLENLGRGLPSTATGLKLQLGREILRQGRHRVLPRRWVRSRVVSEWLAEEVRALGLLQIAVRTTGDVPRILYATVRGLNQAEKGAPPSVLAESYALAQVIAASVSLDRLAERYRTLAEAALAEQPDPVAESWLYQMAGIRNAGACRWEASIAACRTACRIAREIGFTRRWEESSISLGGSLFASCQLKEAEQVFLELRESALRGADRHLNWALTTLISLYLMCNRVQDAESRLKELRPLLSKELDPGDRLLIHTARANVRLRRGDLSGARESADAAGELLEGLPPTMIEIGAATMDLLRIWSAMLPEPGQGEPDPIVVKKSRALCRRLNGVMRPFPFLGPDTEYLKGLVQWRTGNPAKAARCWSRSISRAKRVRMPLPEAKAGLALVRTGKATSEAVDLDAHSRQLLKSMGLDDVWGLPGVQH